MKWLLVLLLAASTSIAADLSITVANVRFISGRTAVVTTTSAVTAGQLLNNGGSWTIHQVSETFESTSDVGIALNSNQSADLSVTAQLDGRIDIGATTVSGTVYTQSIDNDGGIGPYSDLTDDNDGMASGAGITIVGVASDTAGTLELVMEVVDMYVNSGVITANY